jgi:pyochelin biosynthetic protein PchC
VSWLRTFAAARPDAARLVCFPHAGGSATAFRPLALLLAPHVEVLTVQYPGRHDRRGEPLMSNLRTAARSIAAELAGLPRSGPVMFFGHSMGAIVAFETAHAGTRPGVLIASGARAPSAVEVDSAVLGSDGALVDEVVRLGATSADVFADAGLRAMVLPPIRADYSALRAYTADPAAVLDVPVHAWVGDTDPRVSAAQARAWAAYTSASFDLRVFRGDHFYLLPRLREVAQAVGAQLAALV